MAARDETVEALAGFALFADLGRPQLVAAAGAFDEVMFAEGERVLRQGLTASGFFVIVEGEAEVVVDGRSRAVLRRGEFFGEVSVLLGEPPTADVVAHGALRCLVIAEAGVEAFLVANPPVMYRVLQAQARRLRDANRWRS